MRWDWNLIASAMLAAHVGMAPCRGRSKKTWIVTKDWVFHRGVRLAFRDERPEWMRSPDRLGKLRLG